MATMEQIENLLAQLNEAPPSTHFQQLDRNTVGIQAILKYLCATDEKVTPGKISEHMKVSTARVAVLLKKMAAKGLIEKEQDPDDGRGAIVKITELGRQTAEAFRENIYRTTGEMIDRVGMDRMLEFAAISKEIHSIMSSRDMDI